MTEFTKKLQQMARVCPAVAFDVFGTLLRRDAASPTDLFRLMELLGGAEPGFAEKRMAAERAAREAAPGREITLGKIYARLPEQEPQAELDAELAAAVADPAMLAFYHWCKKRGKRVYVISDMYLPAVQIRAMLRACGYNGFDGVFVSSEYGVQKRSGKLFGCFLRETGLNRREVLFVGDDPRADGLGAAVCGIRCALLPKPARPAYLPPPADAAQGCVYAAVQNCAMRGRYTDPEQARAFALGAELLGPLTVCFCRWLHRRCGGGRLLFLARDMELVCRAYRLLYPARPAGYLRVSRRSLCPAALCLGNREVLLALLPRQTLSAAELAAYCGVQDAKAVCRLAGCAPQRRFDLRKAPEEATALLDALAQAARQDADLQEQAALCREYLQAAGVFEPGAVLVDIGSGGTTQWVLRALGAGELRGGYLARDERLRQRFSPGQAEACLFGDGPAPLWYWAGQPMLELFLSEPCGTTAGYRRGRAGGSEPVWRRTSLRQVPPVLRALREGAWAYIRRAANSPAGSVEPNVEYAIAPFLALVRCPRLQDAALFGPLQVEDGGIYPLAQPSRAVHYLRRPGALPAELKNARWKIGFLRRLLVLPLPYDTLYQTIKEGG